MTTASGRRGAHTPQTVRLHASSSHTEVTGAYPEASDRREVSLSERGGGDASVRRKRILVVANETVSGEALRETIERLAYGYDAEVLVVCPALNTRFKHWLSDVDDAITAATGRLEASLAALAELGISAQGRVGDSDPVQAIEDALQTFPADDIIVSTHPHGRSNWLEKGVVERAREHFDQPITHVVVDLELERAALSSGTGADAAGSASSDAAARPRRVGIPRNAVPRAPGVSAEATVVPSAVPRSADGR